MRTMRTILAAGLIALAATQAAAQLQFGGAIRFDYVHSNDANAPLLTSDLGGAFVKTATMNGNTLTLTYQQANGTEASFDFVASGGGTRRLIVTR